jgi:hypothetical protein
MAMGDRLMTLAAFGAIAWWWRLMPGDHFRRESRCQDVALIEQVEHADDQSENSKPAR